MKKITYIIAALAFGVFLAGCGGVKVDNAASGSGTAATVKHRTPKKAYEDQIKLAWVPWNVSDAVGTAWGEGIRREISVYPNVAFQIFDGKSLAETQVQIITDLINQKYDAIILQSADSAALADSVRKAEDAGIPVICLNLDADTPHAGLIAMIDIEAGALIAQQIARALKDQGNVVIIQAAIGASRGERLEAGFRAEMAKHPNIKILDAQTGEWITDKARVVMSDYLTKYPKIDAVFAHNDAMAEGASQAVESVGRLKEMVIWGADGEKKMLEYIENNKLTGTIYTNCYDQGATAARLAMYLLNSDIDTSQNQVTPVIKMSPIIVTKENVNTIGENIRW
ncbi:sugar ABC transporter substrate-binding protein [Treponema primitia]|uniref:sugar ABC transporter substrate-binding protein n=1 Tax=Treponema primitia TaxID=88058 RepID=UPI0039811727